MPKKDWTELIKTEKDIVPSVIVEEMQSDVEEQFEDNKMEGIVTTLLENDKPMLQLVWYRHVCCSIWEVQTYEELIYMQFQLVGILVAVNFFWKSLAAINISENDAGYSKIVTIRNTWLEFCRESNTPVNPVMLAVSSRLDRFLLDHLQLLRILYYKGILLKMAVATLVSDSLMVVMCITSLVGQQFIVCWKTDTRQLEIVIAL